MRVDSYVHVRVAGAIGATSVALVHQSQRAIDMHIEHATRAFDLRASAHALTDKARQITCVSMCEKKKV